MFLTSVLLGGADLEFDSNGLITDSTHKCSASQDIIVISAKARAIYDQFGEEGLKGGVPDKGSLRTPRLRWEFNMHTLAEVMMISCMETRHINDVRIPCTSRFIGTH